METTVLVVGAGPSGLTMAIELARSGIPFRLIDRASHGAVWSQALVVQARTLEQFERYGIAAEAVRRGHRVQGAKAFSEGRMIAQVALAHRIPGRYPFVLFFPQRDTEGLLTERLTSLGGVVERGLELVDYADREGGIDAQIRPEAGEMETCRARWIVGCDGIHSTVRAIAGVPFEGNDADEFFALADVQLSGKDSPGDELHVYLHAGEVVFLARLSAQLYRVMVARRIRPPSDAPPGREELQDAIDRIARADVRVADPAWASRFHIAQRKAVHYRAGRAFLGGDAAHVHSPAGGQGMNTGIQDAANLAWKIAAVERGAPASLLDSYDVERGDVGRALLATTSLALGAATSPNRVVEFVRDVFLSLASQLPAVQQRLAETISETAIAYRHGDAISDGGGSSGVRAGDRAPDVTLHDAQGNTRQLHDLLVQPRPFVLGIDADAEFSAAAREAGPYAGREPLYYVIRPDGYVGYRGPARARTELAAYAASIGCTSAPARESAGL